MIITNWRANLLTSLEVVLELISQTTTDADLTVTALNDRQRYPLGRKVTDADLVAWNLSPNVFHGEWNLYYSPSCYALTCLTY